MSRTSEPLARFEERLLAELKTEILARQPDLRPAIACSPRPRRVLTTAAVIAVSAAAAAGLVAGTTATHAGKPAVSYSLAADFLNQAAAAARAKNAPLPGPDQASYLEQVVVSSGPHGRIRRGCNVTWIPSPLTGLAYVAFGKCGPGVPLVPVSQLKQMASLPNPSYAYPALDTLPTSPAALRAALYAAAARGGAAWHLPAGYSADAIVESLISILITVPMSGPLRAAVYEVLAQVPGVTLDRNAVDVTGRHGIGIIMKLDYPGSLPLTREIIFAPGTFTVLGGSIIMPGMQEKSAIIGNGLVTLPRS
jgi:hypothetical protein